MALWDALKGLFPQLKNLVGIENINFNIQVFSGNKKIVVNQGTARFNPDLMTPKERREFANVIKEAIEEENYFVLQKECNTILGDVISCEQLPDTIDKIAFLKGVFPDDEFQIWRAGLYLAKCFHEGKRTIVPRLKHDMVQRYGKRGGDIANICSAGYLENYLIPLYQDLERANPETAKAIFQRVCRIVVGESAFAIFVSHYHNLTNLQEEIEAKIAINSRYGIHFLNIHTIGSTNKKIVEEVLAIMANKYDVVLEQTTERTIFATITPKAKSLPPTDEKPTSPTSPTEDK